MLFKSNQVNPVTLVYCFTSSSIMKPTAFLFIFLAVLSSCTSNFLVESARISEVDGGFSKLAVFANTQDLIIRRKFEDNLAAALNAVPVQSSPTYPFGLEKQDAEQSLETFRAQGIEGILVTQLLNKEEYTRVISGNFAPYYYYPVRWGRYWGFYPATFWQYNQVIKGNIYYVQTALYDIRKGEDKLIWVGKFEISDPTDMDKVISKYVGELMNEISPYLINDQ